MFQIPIIPIPVPTATSTSAVDGQPTWLSIFMIGGYSISAIISLYTIKELASATRDLRGKPSRAERRAQRKLGYVPSSWVRGRKFNTELEPAWLRSFEREVLKGF